MTIIFMDKTLEFIKEPYFKKYMYALNTAYVMEKKEGYLKIKI